MRAFSCLALSVFTTCAIFAQAADSVLHFEAADVHSAPRALNQIARGPFQTGTRYDFHNATMVDLIVKAYGVTADKVVEGPTWLEWDRFDIGALMPPRTSANDAKLMLQALLAERFGLAIKREERSVQTHVLTAPKGSQKLEESDGSGNIGCGIGIQSSGPSEPGGAPPPPTVNYNCHNESMAAFAEGLVTMPLAQQILGSNPVQDKTGLEGNWDFTLRFSLPTAGSNAGATSFQDALDKQLGLKLEQSTIPLPVIVVERANRIPTPNAPGVAQKIPSPPTEFEVATIKPIEMNGSSRPNFMGMRVQPGGRVELNLPFRNLVQQAWNVQMDAIAGAPKWFESDNNLAYSIVAKMPAGFGGTTTNTSVDNDILMTMLRSLLEDRFQIKAHLEDRPTTAYTLTAPKPKMKTADPSGRTKFIDSGGPIFLNAGSSPSRTIKFQNVTMAQFADKLQFIGNAFLHSPVIDATGLDGGYDFSLSFSPLPPALLAQLSARGADGAAADPIGGVTIFDAVDKQLGLKLVEQKRPAPVLVIDHMEQKPTDN